MGFRNGAYATVWSVEPITDTRTKGRISISKKNKETGAYDSEFNGFVTFWGTSTAGKAANLKERDRIKLGDVDVRNYYDKEKNVTYYNFNIFSFENQESGNNPNASAERIAEIANNVGDGELDDSILPF